MARFSKLLIYILLSLLPLDGYCCTSFIVSGSVRADGRPLMLKHRDSGCLDVRMEWFRGPKYTFTGVVNSPSEGGEVWTGTNSAGLSVMNTATYDLKDDDIPQSEMDREGIMMFDVLGKCATVSDFKAYLDTLPKPWGVEANFGLVDAHGGAAYFEVNNHSYTMIDVASEPGGYMVVTNFTRTGRVEDRKGVDRYVKACGVMRGLDVATIGHKEVFKEFSRSYEPILRDITSCSIVIEGVGEGESPSGVVTWAIVGSPSNCFYFPLLERGFDSVPFFMRKTSGKANCEICDMSLGLKDELGLNPGCVPGLEEIERYVDAEFSPEMSLRRYERMAEKTFAKFSALYYGNVNHKIAESDKND